MNLNIFSRQKFKLSAKKSGKITEFGDKNVKNLNSAPENYDLTELQGKWSWKWINWLRIRLISSFDVGQFVVGTKFLYGKFEFQHISRKKFEFGALTGDITEINGDWSWKWIVLLRIPLNFIILWRSIHRWNQISNRKFEFEQIFPP